MLGRHDDHADIFNNLKLMDDKSIDRSLRGATPKKKEFTTIVNVRNFFNELDQDKAKQEGASPPNNV